MGDLGSFSNRRISFLLRLLIEIQIKRKIPNTDEGRRGGDVISKSDSCTRRANYVVYATNRRP